MSENGENKSGGLNGLRIPLVIDGVMFLTLMIGGTVLWADVQQLKDERLQRVSAERMAMLEGRLEALTIEVRRADVEGQRDRGRLWAELDRQRNGRRMDLFFEHHMEVDL
jgi:hypothetical protein